MATERLYQTFDDVYTVFMDSTRVDEFQLPQTSHGMYALVQQALDRYLIFYDNAKDVSFDSYTETFDMDLEYFDIQLIANYMKLIILEKINDEFVSTYDVLVDDIGIRNYKSQAEAKASAVREQQNKIKMLLFKISDNFDVIDDF